MGGVDRFDQNVSLYRVSIRGKKWYFPTIIDCLDTAEQNAWQLYRLDGGKMDHLGFRRRLVCNILETHGKKTTKTNNRLSKNFKVDSRFDNIGQLVIPQEKQTRCGQCHQKCTSRCKKCDIGLHVKCFELYHTRN
ncbi:piggyBac transposable element-derived protein 3-like [Diaphorina citri]|uniref:PiggyBac transposable element-derived protein 3-like n=1 Tax=Diaphorina citri TaxID=121845 RepID=A0A3Q0J2Z1_DIACI|nr:piggyBac transposable element-derived protein 3-like [Diaphorina citri]